MKNECLHPFNPTLFYNSLVRLHGDILTLAFALREKEPIINMALENVGYRVRILLEHASSAKKLQEKKRC